MRALTCFALLSQRDELKLAFLTLTTIDIDQSQNVFVKNLALAIGQLLEACESLIDGGFAIQLHTQLLQALFEGVATAELAQHDFVGGPAHIFSPHDFIGVTRLEHAILVNARSMSKRIGTHHRLVGLHDKACGLADQTTGRHDVLGVDIHIQPKVILAGLDGHDDLFK